MRARSRARTAAAYRAGSVPDGDVVGVQLVELFVPAGLHAHAAATAVEQVGAAVGLRASGRSDETTLRDADADADADAEKVLPDLLDTELLVKLVRGEDQ